MGAKMCYMSPKLKKEDDSYNKAENIPHGNEVEIVITPSEETQQEGDMTDLGSDNLQVDGAYCLRASREVIYPEAANLLEAGLEDVDVEIAEGSKDIAHYCLLLLGVHFQGQTCKSCHKRTDVADIQDVLNLGVCLSLLDKYLKGFQQVTEFNGQEEDYKMLLNLIARKRCRLERNETAEECLKRLMEESKRFVNILHKRGEQSEVLEHQQYWGTKQQLLSGKVIADYIDRDNGPLDPIFGVLLQPTAGRVGPGDSSWVHEILFDGDKHMAFHSAVHDAFGYLMNNHNVGPGYDYMNGSTWFDTHNPLAGQTPGIHFWKKAIDDINEKNKVLKHWVL